MAYKCISSDLKKTSQVSKLFSHTAQFHPKERVKSKGNQNKWSDRCPSRRKTRNSTTERKYS